MPASTHPSIKVNMVSIENVLAAYSFLQDDQLFVEMLIRVGDLLYRRKNDSPLGFALPVRLL